MIDKKTAVGYRSLTVLVDPDARCRQHLFMVVVLLSGLLMAGCAGRQSYSNAFQQTCNPSADAAVAAGNWQKALVDHERLLIKEPANCLAMYHLGFILGYTGDREREIDFYEAAVECGYVSDEQLFFNLGMAYGDLDELDRAAESFERAVAIDPENPDAHFGLGLTHQRAGRSDQAEAALMRTVAADPLHRHAHLMLVRLYLDQSRWNKAQVHLEIIGRIDPDDEEARELHALMHSRRTREYHR